MKDLTQNSEEKRQELLFKKIDQKAQALLEKFKHSTPLSNQLPEQERVRQRIRENLFYALVFGLEECKNKQYSSETDDMREHIVDISKFLMKDEKSQVEHIKNITLSIEANLYHKYNKDVGKTSAYSNKSRLVAPSHQIFMNLKHKKNFDLRLKVLVEAITPSQLCLMNEDVAPPLPQELAPSVVKNIRKEEQERYLHSKLITEEATFIPKAKKSELLVGAPEDNGLPPLSLETELELEADTKAKGGDLWNDDDDLMRDKSNLNNIDKLYEELNPRKLVEKAHVRLKTYLPQEAADQLIQKTKS